MEKIPKGKVEKALSQIEEIHHHVTSIMTHEKTDWLDVSETCRFLKISTRTLQNYRNQGLIPFSQVNSKIYFRKNDLQEFLESHMQGKPTN